MDDGATVGDDGGGGEPTAEGAVPESPVSYPDGGCHRFRWSCDRSVTDPNSATEPNDQPAAVTELLSTLEQGHVTGVHVGDGA